MVPFHLLNTAFESVFKANLEKIWSDRMGGKGGQDHDEQARNVVFDCRKAELGHFLRERRKHHPSWDAGCSEWVCFPVWN